MDVVLTIVAFLAIIVVLVLVHEIGHFAVAKWAGVAVQEFGVGFPPRIASVAPSKRASSSRRPPTTRNMAPIRKCAVATRSSSAPPPSEARMSSDRLIATGLPSSWTGRREHN